MFFAGFNTNGEREFCSYYGGISTTTSEINPYLDNDGSLYLWGTTNSSTDIATSNGYYSTMTNPSLNQPFGYVAKFNLKTMNTVKQISQKIWCCIIIPIAGIFIWREVCFRNCNAI